MLVATPVQLHRTLMKNRPDACVSEESAVEAVTGQALRCDRRRRRGRAFPPAAPIPGTTTRASAATTTSGNYTGGMNRAPGADGGQIPERQCRVGKNGPT